MLICVVVLTLFVEEVGFVTTTATTALFVELPL
jgi:hypothetical protein